MFPDRHLDRNSQRGPWMDPRTRLLLEGPIAPTLLRLARPTCW